ncbi:hypothetical protein D9M73_206890 [compost metagenome]
MDDAGGSLFDAFLHDLATMPGIGQARREDLTQRGIGTQFLEFFLVQLLVLDPHPDLAEQMWRGNAAGSQRPQPFGDDADSGNGAQNDRQHHPTTGLDQFPHS